MLRPDPVGDLTPMYQFLPQIVLLLFAITVHEYAHAYVADKRGDDTARLMGRLTLNPIAHIDMFGTVLLPMLLIITRSPILFGWAKPVPINPHRLSNMRKDVMLIGLAGPAANFLLAIISSFCLWLARSFGVSEVIMSLLVFFLQINILLAVFNLIPVPPLDGGNVITGLLPAKIAYQYEKLKPYGFFIILFLWWSGLLSSIIGPIVNFLVHWLVSGGIVIHV